MKLSFILWLASDPAATGRRPAVPREQRSTSRRATSRNSDSGPSPKWRFAVATAASGARPSARSVTARKQFALGILTTGACE